MSGPGSSAPASPEAPDPTTPPEPNAADAPETEPGALESATLESATPESGTPEPGGLPRHGRQDALLDLVRSVAIVRVVLWHTWSWAWLSWIPAMPAMFFTSGALLEGSLERRGWWATLRQRARRLMIPYWTYAAACWVVMVASGWRPSGLDALTWMVPLADPVGSAELSGLWVPLWYVRAYLWFVLGSGALRFVHRRLGWASVPVAVAAGVGAYWWSQDHALPLAVGDAAAYAPFVLAGMLYGAGRRLPGRAALTAIGVSSFVAALLVWQRLGPVDGVVNRSYLLTMAVGMGGLGLVLAWRTELLSLTARGTAIIRTLNSRALTIYLWQGFGLVAAHRLVDARVDAAWLRIPLSLLVVGLVIAAAVAVVGGLEDVAARRRPSRVLPRSWIVPGAVLVAFALVVPLPEGAAAYVPLSGQAVVERAARVEADLAGDGGDDARPVVAGVDAQTVLDEWVAEHRDRLDAVGTEWLDIALVDGDGELQYAVWHAEGATEPDRLAWWSMTKAVTTTWFARLIGDGVVGLDDPLSRWVPETPRAEDMTLEQLARHTAGVPEDLTRHIFAANPAEEIEEFVDRGELAYEPGEGYGYSRVGYYLLALALERASGVPYVDAVGDMAEQAGVRIDFDETDPAGPVTDPDGHGYRGGPWSSGGLVSDLDDAARFVQWLFADGVDDEGLDLMTSFSSDPDQIYYGLGLLPLCPCETVGDRLRSERFGLDTVPGLFGVDRASGATVVLRPDSWWTDDGPVDEFYDLQQRLLDSASG